MKLKFKKGDIVRAKETSWGGEAYIQGNTYEVHRHQVDRNVVETVLDEHGSQTNGWGVDKFELVEKPAAIATQVGGTHYTDMAIQPATYNLANGLGWAEGDAISYISRWRNKGGLQDLRKARQTLLLLIEYEEGRSTV